MMSQIIKLKKNIIPKMQTIEPFHFSRWRDGRFPPPTLPPAFFFLEFTYFFEYEQVMFELNL